MLSTKPSAKLEWKATHSEALERVKQGIIDKAIGYFKKDWSTILEVDASPVGIGALLYQESPCKKKRQIVACWSKLLSDIERRYSQVEREALGVVVACERFRHYIIGHNFTLITDCKAVELILRNPAAKPPIRIARFVTRLMDYDFDVIHKPGADNMADYLSRSPLEWLESDHNNSNTRRAEQFVHFVTTNGAPRAINTDEWARETRTDVLLARVIALLGSGRKDKTPELKPYLSNRHELSVSADGILLRDERLVVPESLQAKVIRLAHEGHQGVVKTAKLLRQRVWFPAMSKRVEDALAQCAECQLSAGGTRPQPTRSTEMSARPWTHLATDFYGPLGNMQYLLVIKDECTRFPVVAQVPSTSSLHVIPVLERIFSEYGRPEQIKSDNGPPFNGDAFAGFCLQFGVQHRRITPLHPKANGQCENFMKNINKVVRNSQFNGNDFHAELCAFLRSYRATPHSYTGKAPSELLFTNSNPSRLPSRRDESEPTADIKEAREHDARAKDSMANYADRRRGAKQHDFLVGDLVLLDQFLGKKIRDKKVHKFDKDALTVTGVKGSMISTTNQIGHKLTRDAKWFKHLTSDSLAIGNINLLHPE